MSFIRTVCGDIDPVELGPCYAHEHVLGRPLDPGEDPDFRLDSEPAAVAELSAFREAGGRALVEMSPADYGRDAAGLRRVARAAGVHLIACTGHHKEKFSGPFVRGQAVETLADRFVRELTEGIDGTDVRAGVIKAGSSLNAITPGEERVFRAAARAHRATGAPISTHTEVGTMAHEQVALLQAEGVAPRHVILGHLDRRLEVEFLLRVARTGAFLGFDQVGKEKYYPDGRRVAVILELVRAGFGGQILLAGDLARRSYWPSYGTGGRPGLTYILRQFVPALREAGLAAQTVDDLLVGNPARALAWAPSGVPPGA